MDRAIEDMAINIIVDMSDPNNAVFVEIENDAGQSIRIGSPEDDEFGLTKIRVSVSDIVNNELI